MANNADWLNTLNYIDFLRDVGRYFSVNRMLAFDSVKLRLETPARAVVPRIQLHDPASLRLCGTEQAIRLHVADGRLRPVGQHRQRHRSRPAPQQCSSVRAHGAADHHRVGRQDGKTAAGAVWLNADLLSPYDYWQFWRNTEDGDVVRFLKLFTILPLDEVTRLAALQGGEINEAKKVLATEATALMHGRASAEQAADTAQKTFEQGALAENLPTVEMPRAELDAGLGVLTAFVTAGLVASNGEARRQIKAGGLKINDATITDEKTTLTTGALTPEGVIKLSLGKKKHVLIKPV